MQWIIERYAVSPISEQGSGQVQFRNKAHSRKICYIVVCFRPNEPTHNTVKTVRD